MDFLKKNARSIVVALLAAGVIIAVSTTANNSNDETGNNTDTTQNAPEGDTTKEESTTPTETVETTQTPAPETPQASTNDEGDRVTANVQNADDVYSATARSGDNQTLLIRDVMSNYTGANKTELSPEQKLYLETALVDSLPRNDVINPGEVIKISKSVLEAKITEAKQLDQITLNRWSKYL